MANEDKLQLTKEALASGSYDKETIEYIFPELRESEDEKIRKGLINMLSQDYELHKKEIAWLEKQDKQKLVDINAFLINKMVNDYKNTDEYVEGDYKGKPVLCMVRAYRQGIEDAIQKFELQKAVEDGCKNSDDITTEEKDITEYKKGFECGKQYVLKYPRDYGLCKILVERKSSWSEEDENYYQNCLKAMRTYSGKDTPVSKWIESLKDRVQPQPKQEWNKEDKDNLSCVIATMEEDAQLPMNVILLGKNIMLDSIKVLNGLTSILEKDFGMLRKLLNG